MHGLARIIAVVLLLAAPSQAQMVAAGSDAEHRHAETLLRLADALGAGDAAAFAGFYTGDAELHATGRRGPDGAAALLRDLRTVLPDARWTVELVIAQGSFASARGWIEGTARGRRIRFEIITQHRFEDGRIAEQWEQYDSAHLP